MSETLRDHSKKTWIAMDKTLASINAGSLQRIADATDLIRDRDNYERYYREAVNRERQLGLRLAAAKGQITKLRNAAKKEPK